MSSVYGEKPVEYVKDLPPPKEKAVRITAFHDSGLAMCKVTGESYT